MYTLFRSGPFLYGIAILALGVEHFVTGNFPTALLPIAVGTPGRIILVYSVGAILSATGLCIIFQKKPGWAALLAGSLVLLLDATVHLPKLIANPYNGGEWTVFTELVALAGGAFLLAGNFWTDAIDTNRSRIAPNRLIWYGCLLYAVSLLIFGIQHWLYGPYVATLIPSWIPAHLFWAYFVGFAFLAAAVSILLKKQVSLVAMLLGVMFILWVVLLHAPRVVGHLHTETEWTSAFIALAMGGISFSLPVSPVFNRLFTNQL
ncbi:hypothetical protein GO755_31290 [Spirosoma sp. HMF4905]|uniref:DoxX family protein n=1 Tax=Spirosoma arboris TaxID=2682092 RepID=A0A7K1SL96_9BACT|nr:hypothetical protein [Spirosoma arboris]MVM34555.1 hypothetical protein [Spirosoma arboris]